MLKLRNTYSKNNQKVEVHQIATSYLNKKSIDKTISKTPGIDLRKLAAWNSEAL